MNKTFTLILGFFLLGAIGFAGWLFIQSLLEADPGITAAIIGAIAVVIAGMWSHYTTRRREINSRHFIEKKNAYMQFIEMMFEFIMEAKEEDDPSKKNKVPKHESKEVMAKMLNFKKELLVWGNHEVISAMQNFEARAGIDSADEASKEKDSIHLFLVVDDLLRAIRKDLGHNDSQLKRGSLSGMLLIAEDREKVLSDKNIKEAS
jgi:hypothetical protein